MSEDIETWQNYATNVVTVKKGDPISVEVTGGYIKKAAPSEGFLIEARSGYHIFVPVVGKKALPR